jgi:predicted RNA-binding protein with PUA-like domain
VVVDLKPKQKLARPVTLAAIKADPAFAGWDFLRIGRLSVVPVPEAMWRRILDLSNDAAPRDAVAGAKPRTTGSKSRTAKSG